MSVDLVRIIDSIHREKNIPKESLIEAIQSALTTAARKHYPDATEIEVVFEPDSGKLSINRDGQAVSPSEFGRITAQTAKQIIFQKFREAERDTLFEEFEEQRGEMITGTVQRFDGGAVTVNLGKTDALLPKSEQIAGESHQPGERIRAVVLEVRKVGQRVKIILSRTHQDFVRRLFELEIPEIADQTIQIRGIAREAGYRSKVAVSSSDQKVDAVGACVGGRGTRIKSIVDELSNERIDIVRWNESLQVLIRNALQPAEIEEVLLCNLLDRAIVLVRDDQLSLAIGRRGQNVRLASKLVGWSVEIMTAEELDEVIDRAVNHFSQLEGCTPETANQLVEQGILSYEDLSMMEVSDLVNTIDGLDETLATALVAEADARHEAKEQEETPRRKGGRSAVEGLASLSSSDGAKDVNSKGDGVTPESDATLLPTAPSTGESVLDRLRALDDSTPSALPNDLPGDEPLGEEDSATDTKTDLEANPSTADSSTDLKDLLGTDPPDHTQTTTESAETDLEGSSAFSSVESLLSKPTPPSNESSLAEGANSRIDNTEPLESTQADSTSDSPTLSESSESQLPTGDDGSETDDITRSLSRTSELEIESKTSTEPLTPNDSGSATLEETEDYPPMDQEQS